MASLRHDPDTRAIASGPQRRSLPLFFALGSVLLPGVVNALGLGEILSQSFLGEPLRLTLAVVVAPGEEPRPECFRVLASDKPGSEELPQLASGSVSLLGSGSEARLQVSTSRPVNEPVLRVSLSVGCEQTTLVRDYTLLLDPPLRPTRPATEQAVPQAATASASVPAAAASSLPSAAPATASVVADAPSPSRRVARPATPLIAGSSPRSGPFAGPILAREIPTKPGAGRLRLLASPTGASAAPLAPRLVLSTALSELAQGPAALSEDALALLRAKQARLKAAPEDQDLTTSVEAELVVLDKRLKDLQATLDSAQARIKTLEAREPPVISPPIPAPEPRQSSINYSDWFMFAALGIFVLAATAILIHRRRQAQLAQSWPAEDELERKLQPPASLPLAAPPASEADPGEPEPMPRAAAPGVAYYHVGDITHQLSVSELAQVTEEARVFLTLGHPDKAVLALREHVDLHPDTAPAPWLMLLDIYRRTGNRGEYERASAEFRQRFNAFIPPWEDPSAGQDGPGLEAYPHLVKQVCDLWRNPACKAFLDELLYDNRGGNRIGFNLTAYQDIMVLRALLEQQVGLDEPTALARTPPSATKTAPPLTPVADLEFELDQDLLPAPAYRCALETDHPGVLERLTLNWNTPHVVHFLESLLFADHTAKPSFSETALSELMLLHDVALEIAGIKQGDQWEQDPSRGRKSAH